MDFTFLHTSFAIDKNCMAILLSACWAAVLCTHDLFGTSRMFLSCGYFISWLLLNCIDDHRLIIFIMVSFRALCSCIFELPAANIILDIKSLYLSKKYMTKLNVMLCGIVGNTASILM
jgi:hypothetical protein